MPICGQNSLLTAVDEARAMIENQVDAALAQFDAAKSQIDSLQAQLTATVTSAFESVSEQVTTLVNSAQAELNKLAQVIPVYDSFPQEFAALAGADIETIRAFTEKWRSAVPNFDEYQTILDQGPIAFAEYLTQIDFCKDLPNVKLDPATGASFTAPAETAPPNENPTNAAITETSVVDNSVDRADAYWAYVEYRRELHDTVFAPLNEIQAEIANRRQLHYQNKTIRVIRSARDRGLSLSEYRVSQYITDNELSILAVDSSIMQEAVTITEVISKLSAHAKAYEVGVTDDVKARVNTHFVGSPYEPYLVLLRGVIDANRSAINDYASSRS